MKNGKAKLRRGPGVRIGGQMRARRERGDGRAVYAALDLGTNNCRLLVAMPDNQGFRVVDAFSRIVRLGEGLERDGCLAEAAIERTIGALRICAAKIAKKPIAGLRNVATEACRRAANGNDFLARVRAETGLAFDIISPREEAQLALTGCAPLLVADRPFGLVFDIGGGSTEIMWVAQDDGGVQLIDSLSIPLGVVSLAERHGGDRVSAEAYGVMIDCITAEIADFESRNRINERIGRGEVQMLGTSGTVTTLAGIHLKLPSYDRNSVDGCFLEFDQINAVTRYLLSLDYAGRATEPCIGHARADLVLAGCAILDAICKVWPVGRLRVADRGVREGILFNLMRQDDGVMGAV